MYQTNQIRIIEEDLRQISAESDTFYNSVVASRLPYAYSYDPGKQSEWFDTDSAETFDSLPEHLKQAWCDIKISYQFNQYGFRCSEFKESEYSNAICFLGCSFTVGLGVPKDQTWSHIVSDQLNMTELNYAVLGGSLYSQHRIYQHWGRIHKPKLTVLLPPPSPRIELFTEDRINTYKSGLIQNVGPSVKKFWIDNHFNSCESYVRHIRGINAIKGIAAEIGSDLIVISNQPCVDLARDGIHPGPQWHKEMSQKVINHTKKLSQ
jgi:hypothetical protein